MVVNNACMHVQKRTNARLTNHQHFVRTLQHRASLHDTARTRTRRFLNPKVPQRAGKVLLSYTGGRTRAGSEDDCNLPMKQCTWTMVSRLVKKHIGWRCSDCVYVMGGWIGMCACVAKALGIQRHLYYRLASVEISHQPWCVHFLTAASSLFYESFLISQRVTHRDNGQNRTRARAQGGGGGYTQGKD